MNTSTADAQLDGVTRAAARSHQIIIQRHLKVGRGLDSFGPPGTVTGGDTIRGRLP